MASGGTQFALGPWRDPTSAERELAKALAGHRRHARHGGLGGERAGHRLRKSLASGAAASGPLTAVGTESNARAGTAPASRRRRRAGPAGRGRLLTGALRGAAGICRGRACRTGPGFGGALICSPVPVRPGLQSRPHPRVCHEAPRPCDPVRAALACPRPVDPAGAIVPRCPHPRGAATPALETSVPRCRCVCGPGREVHRVPTRFRCVRVGDQRCREISPRTAFTFSFRVENQCDLLRPRRVYLCKIKLRLAASCTFIFFPKREMG